MTRYYIGQIFERNGEYEYTLPVLIEIADDQLPSDRLKWIAESQYEDDDKYQDERNAGWYFNGGDVYVEPRKWREISKAA